MTLRASKPTFNVREKLTELGRRFGLKGSELAAAETVQEARDLVSAGRKNFIINGDFQVSQRGSYTSATAVSQNTYYLDRWKVDISGITGTIQHLTNQTISSDSHIKNTVKMAATSTATAYVQLRQVVELNPALYGKTVTVSAWVKSNRSARLRLESAYYGGSNWDSLTAHSGNGQWEKLSMTVRLQTSPSNIVFGVILWGGSGGTTGGTTSISSGDYFEFTDFQVEVGKNATDFEHRSYGEELALCRRYFEVMFSLSGHGIGSILGRAINTTQMIIPFEYQVEKRAAPTLDETGGGSGGTGRVYYNGVSFTTTYTITDRATGTKGGRLVFSGMSGLIANTVIHFDVNTTPPFSLWVNAEL